MINGLDIYYSKNVGRGLQPISTKRQTISTKGRGLKPISKGQGCEKIGNGLKILQ